MTFFLAFKGKSLLSCEYSKVSVVLLRQMKVIRSFCVDSSNRQQLPVSHLFHLLVTILYGMFITTAAPHPSLVSRETVLFFLHQLTPVFYFSLAGAVNWISSRARCDPPIFSPVFVSLCVCMLQTQSHRQDIRASPQ